MRCKIADLIVEIPEVGDLVPRCLDYSYNGEKNTDIVIRTDLFREGVWSELTDKEYIYMESGGQFYFTILKFDGMMLHASAVELDGKAYLFSGPCGTGKSTHTRFWETAFGPEAVVFNDDKPALRCIDGVWYAFGTPWCGKDGINVNKKIPLAGICFLKQAKENKIYRLIGKKAVPKLIHQTIHRFHSPGHMDVLLHLVGDIIDKVPIFEFENRPEMEAAMISQKAMSLAAKEYGL